MVEKARSASTDAEHLARGRVDHRDRVERGRAQRDAPGREALVARHVAAVVRLAELARRRPGRPRDRATRRPESRRPRRPAGSAVPPSGASCAAARTCPVWMCGFWWSRIAASTGRSEELVGMAAEELVERVLAGDVDGEALGPAARATPHLAKARHRAGERDADRRVELADVDARARARPSRPPPGDRPRRGGARSRGAAEAYSRRGRARSARRGPRARAPPGAGGRSAGSARSPCASAGSRSCACPR